MQQKPVLVPPGLEGYFRVVVELFPVDDVDVLYRSVGLEFGGGGGQVEQRGGQLDKDHVHDALADKFVETQRYAFGREKIRRRGENIRAVSFGATAEHFGMGIEKIDGNGLLSFERKVVPFLQIPTADVFPLRKGEGAGGSKNKPYFNT